MAWSQQWGKHYSVSYKSLTCRLLRQSFTTTASSFTTSSAENLGALKAGQVVPQDTPMGPDQAPGVVSLLLHSIIIFQQFVEGGVNAMNLARNGRPVRRIICCVLNQPLLVHQLSDGLHLVNHIHVKLAQVSIFLYNSAAVLVRAFAFKGVGSDEFLDRRPPLPLLRLQAGPCTGPHGGAQFFPDPAKVFIISKIINK